MSVADVIARRVRCVRRRAGCAIVSSTNRIVATGYNGPPAGYTAQGRCDRWCDRAKTGGGLSYDDCVSVHAEANALMFCDRREREGGTAYVTSCPCFTCAKQLANSGLARVVYRVTAEDTEREPQRSYELLQSSQIRVEIRGA
jgi:dCMP deaminase